MNTSGTIVLVRAAVSGRFSSVISRPMTGRQTVAAWANWLPRVAAKPGAVLTAKAPPPARHSVESSRRLHPVSGGEGPVAAGRLRRAGQDCDGHGTPRARAFVASSGVVLCPITTGLTRELIAGPTYRRGERPEGRAHPQTGRNRRTALRSEAKTIARRPISASASTLQKIRARAPTPSLVIA